MAAITGREIAGAARWTLATAARAGRSGGRSVALNGFAECAEPGDPGEPYGPGSSIDGAGADDDEDVARPVGPMEAAHPASPDPGSDGCAEPGELLSANLLEPA
jgi:hypothetical protein